MMFLCFTGTRGLDTINYFVEGFDIVKPGMGHAPLCSKHIFKSRTL